MTTLKRHSSVERGIWVMMRKHFLLAMLGLLHATTAAAQSQDTVIYYHTDAIGSVRMITDQSGQIVARYDYLPFGEPWLPPPSPNQDVRQFAGKERDAETGFDYFGARYYASGSGRFTTVDPMFNVEAAMVDPQRWNRYAYVANRPLSMIDPDGRDPLLLVGGGIGAAIYASWNAYVNVQQGRPWYENIGLEASKGFIVGATLGLAAPALAGTTAAEMAVLTSTVSTGVSSTGVAANALGAAREAYVAKLVGGRVAGDVRITLQGVGSTAIDVYGKAGEMIGVGGPMKAIGPDALSRLGTRLKILATAAQEAGVKAQYYFARGTPMDAFRLAEKWLGKGNVHWYDLPE